MAALALVATAEAYEPVGAELRLSTTLPDASAARDAVETAVAYNSVANEYLVVWAADGLTTDDENEIFGQRVSASGVEIGGDFVISETGQTVNDASRDADNPTVTYNGDKNEYLVAWDGDDDLVVNDEFEIHARLVAANGTVIGGDFPVSDQGPVDNISFEALEPAAAYNPTQDSYLVVWRGDVSAGVTEVFGQRLNDNGGEMGVDFPISDAALAGANRQPLSPAVAYGAATDEWLVTWDGDGLALDNEYEIFAQRVESDGDEVGPDDVRVSQMAGTGSAQRAALDSSVAYGSGPNEWLVTWWGDPFALDGEAEVFGQRLSAAGAEVGVNDFQVSTTGPDGVNTRAGIRPAVSYSATGNEYLAVWMGDSAGASDEFEVNGQRLSATGADIGGDFRISTTGADNDDRDVEKPAVAFGAGPNAFLTTWSADDLATNDEFEIFGRLIGKPAPPASASPAASPPGTSPAPTCTKAKKKKKKKKPRAASSKKKKKKKKRRCPTR